MLFTLVVSLYVTLVGEHIISIQSEKEGGKMLLIKGDLDVLNVNENEVIVVDIKD